MTITFAVRIPRLLLATALLVGVAIPALAQPFGWGMQMMRPGFPPPPPPRHEDGDAPSPNPEVPDYAAIMSQGHLCAVNRAQLPLRYYSSDPARRELVERAAAAWNEAGKAQGLTFIRVLERPEAGAIEVDWSGRGLPPGAAGLASIAKTPEGLHIGGIGMNPRPGVPDSKFVEVLTHEMGHTLGLAHSESPDDLMFRSTRPQSSRSQMLSGRDLQMLTWLYSRMDCRPIAALRN